MPAARLWPAGFISGFCLVGGDHDRCRMPHVADPGITGCHCPVCLEREANPLVVVEAASDPAEAPPAPEPGASAGTTSVPEPPAPSALAPDGTVAVDAVELAQERARLDRVVELHRAVEPLRPSSAVPAYCEHCGRPYPCPTVRLANGEEVAP